MYFIMHKSTTFLYKIIEQIWEWNSLLCLLWTQTNEWKNNPFGEKKILLCLLDGIMAANASIAVHKDKNIKFRVIGW